MKSHTKRYFFAFFTCIFAMALTMSLAACIQSDFGRIDVTEWNIESGGGDTVRCKLYVPKTATPEHPAPAVLLIHGYQNDKDTSAAYALELARRGIVAMAMDAYGHGDTTAGLAKRGYTRHKLPDWDKTVTGPERYLVMMSFSTNDFYTLKDVQGSGMDSSMGGRTAYALLRSMPFVDKGSMGVTGHSMGTWAAWSVAETFQDHKAVVLQCGELFPKTYYDSDKIKFRNVLLLQAEFEEFTAFNDYTYSTKGLMDTELRYREFAGQDAPIAWDTTYGSFADGTARRIELLNGINHRLTVVSPQGISAAVDWFAGAFGIKPAIAPSDQTSVIKELLVFLGLLSALASMLPLLVLLTSTRFFAEVAEPLPARPETLLPRKEWWKSAVTAILISGATYPFLTQLGHGLVPVPEGVFKMTVGNGIITWFLFLAAVAFFMLRHWYKRGGGRRMGVTLYDLGLAGEREPHRFPWRVIGKSALLALILVAAVYAYVTAFHALYGLDFRFVWPLLRPFSGSRFAQFFVYLPFYLVFFLLNGGVKLYGQMRLRELKSPAKTQLVWWLNSVVVMLGGLFIVTLIEYVPFLLGIGAGMDLLFSSTFGGPFISFLIVIIPQFMLLFFLSTYAYRKTGRIYVGSAMLSLLGAWAITASSSFM
jgi:dienelactone hydrolase